MTNSTLKMIGPMRFLIGVICMFALPLNIVAAQNSFGPFLPFVRPEPELIPSPGHSAEVSMSNHFNTAFISQADNLMIDYEQYRFKYRYTRALGRRALVSIGIPFYLHGGGLFDGFISGWHSFFGFPNAGRDNFKRYQYAIRLRQNGVTYYDLQLGHAGFGDVHIGLTLPIDLDDHGLQLALKTQLNLPTGSASKLLGAGKVGGALGIGLQNTRGAVRWFAQGHIMTYSTPSQLDGFGTRTLPYQFDVGTQFSLLGFPMRHTISIYRAPVTGTGFHIIDTTAVIYNFALGLGSFRQIPVIFLFQEDLSTAGTPDFTFGLRFGDSGLSRSQNPTRKPL